MKYEAIKKSAVYTFGLVTIVMTILGIMAVWGLVESDILWRAFVTVFVVGTGCLTVAYTASLLDERAEEKEALPSFAPHPKPHDSQNHIAKD